MQEITKALIKFHNSGAAAKKSANNPYFKSSYALISEKSLRLYEQKLVSVA